MDWCAQLEAVIRQEATRPGLPPGGWIILALAILILVAPTGESR